MAILSRFADIIKANVNSALDKLEDPSKMADQYMLEMTQDLAEVKRDTAGVIAEEERAKRLMEENQMQVEKYADFAKNALSAGDENDARVFIAKKQQLEAEGAGLVTAYAAARENAVKMRQMHDKLSDDIEALEKRRKSIKAKAAVANTQQKVSEVSSSAINAQSAMSAFKRMEDKADRMYDESAAMSLLNSEPVDEAREAEKKYSKGTASVDEELVRLKAEMGL